MSTAYFRYPTVFQEKIAFVSEDDLWEVHLDGGIARRLTAGRGSFRHPQYSPDGCWLALTSAEEGHREIFVMPSRGGDVRRLTYLASNSTVSGWLDDQTVLFRSTAFDGHYAPALCRVPAGGGLAEPLRLGPATNLTIAEDGRVVLERNDSRSDPALWKRYRGGTAGKLWAAPSLEGEFTPLIRIDGNLSRPLWVNGRVYFVSDHERVGNLYSCDASGEDLRRETAHEDFYVRNPSTDGRSIVYHAGGDLYVFDLTEGRSRKVEVEYLSQRTQRQRRFSQPGRHLETAALDGKGESGVYCVRGQIHTMRHWDGPVSVLAESGNRYRLAMFLNDGKRILAVVDKDNGDERLEIWSPEDGSAVSVPAAPDAPGDWGRFVQIRVSPKDDRIAFSNHRNELWTLDLTTGAARKLAVNEYGHMGGFAWSPDGRWLAYPKAENLRRKHIAIANVETGESHQVTEPLFVDFAPSFDPEGRFLYFLSDRVINPVYDELQFQLAFPKATVPCLITLRKDEPSPFQQAAQEEEGKGDEGKGDKNSADDEKDAKDTNGKDTDAKDKDVRVEIDFDGITGRILAFPVPEGRYFQIAGLKKKVLWLSAPVEGMLSAEPSNRPWTLKGRLETFDFKTLSAETLGGGMSGFSLSRDLKKMLIRSGSRLRVVKAGEKIMDAPHDDAPGRKSGWLDLGRLKVLVEPPAEWRQMLHEAWRLQRDHFWREDMSKVDWEGVLKRYLPLVDRINCRSEFADLVWELHGELGTSHAYEHGGDYRSEPHYPVGFLGADFVYDADAGGYRVVSLLRSDPWRPDEACPLQAPGVSVEVGDLLLAVDGRKLTAGMTPHEALLHKAGAEVRLSVKSGDTVRQVRAQTLRAEGRARYRDWVERNRERVREATGGRAGYIHIPDMGARGYAEFHRHFLRDLDRDALIVDVRYNTGGYVSELILERLARRRIGADLSRWYGAIPYPSEAPAGPVVAITNEYAASDGDIFSHAFKLMKLGPLIGRRTWGGVVGISPRHPLIDGGVTTQPEFSFWFKDVGWRLENHGAEPDIDVDNAPHEYRRGVDRQLDRGVAEILRLLEEHPPFRPELKLDVPSA